MKGYIDKLLDDQRIPPGDKQLYPATERLFEADEEADKVDAISSINFHATVARLLFLAKRVRPDLLLTVSFLSGRVKNPDVEDLGKLRHVLAYLSHTRDLGLMFNPDDGKIIHYIDASFATHFDCRSHTGMVVMFGKAMILAKSTKQKIMTKSAAEAEFIALTDFASEVIGMKQFYFGQSHIAETAIIYEDNTACICISVAERGVMAARRMRHINIRRHWIHEAIRDGVLKIEHCDTEDMLADFFTKPLVGQPFFRFRSLIMGCPMTNPKRPLPMVRTSETKGDV